MSDHHFEYQWGYGIGSFNKPERGDFFHVRLPAPSETLLTIKEEALHTAFLLKEKYQGESITLAFSGGLDSQVIALSLKAAQVPFKLITKINIESGHILNESELLAGKAFLAKHQLETRYVEVNIDTQIPHYEELVKNYYPIHWVYLSQLDVLPFTKGEVVILGNGNPHLKPTNKDFFEIEFTPDTKGLARDLGEELIPNYFLYSPNLYYAFLFHPLIQAFSVCREHLVSDYTENGPRNTEYLISRYVRPLMYENEYPGVLVHQKKVNGLEAYSKYFQLKEHLETIANSKARTNSVTVDQEVWETLRTRAFNALTIQSS